MRDAIANAAVGDEQKREDPTVNELERRGAEFLGQEEAVFLPTATMANQIALQILGRPGDALLVERHAHIMLSELGGPAAHSGLLTIGLEGTKGRFSPDQVVSEIRDRTSVHVAPTRIVILPVWRFSWSLWCASGTPSKSIASDSTGLTLPSAISWLARVHS